MIIIIRYILFWLMWSIINQTYRSVITTNLMTSFIINSGVIPASQPASVSANFKTRLMLSTKILLPGSEVILTVRKVSYLASWFERF